MKRITLATNDEIAMTYRAGTIGQFKDWTKRVVRTPAAAKRKPRRWYDSAKTAKAAARREVSPEALVKLLSPANLRLLSILANERPQSVQALADLTGRKQASVSRTLKRLAAAGIVAMARGPNRKLRPELVASRVHLEIDLTAAPSRRVAMRATAA